MCAQSRIGRLTSTTDTRDRILDAAEKLFAERGIAGASLRAITAAADANVAAVHYHFGSKDDLVRAVVLRRLQPLNHARLCKLEQVLADTSPDPAPVEAILDTFFRTPLELWASGGLGSVPFFIVREPAEHVGPLVQEVMGELGRSYVAALADALPHLGPEEVMERFQLVVAVLLHLVSGRMAIRLGPTPKRNVDGQLRFVVTTLAAALRAPSVPEKLQ
jgi:AcrR family transcriptional regulator